MAAMKASVFVILALLIVAASLAQAARIKVHLVKESVDMYHTHVSKRQSSEDQACSDSTPVERGSLSLPGRLNELNSRVKFFRSEYARNNLNLFQDMAEVPLANFPRTILREVLDVLRNNTCLPFFYGGAVRDQFLGASPKDADVEIDCPIETFFNVCISTWGEVNCGRATSRPLGHVGLQNTDLENLDVASTSITFYAPISELEYTVNSMAYDLNGNDVVIDLTGTGEMDVCNKSIRIPSDDDSVSSWIEWLNSTGGSALLRFWKLRIKSFNAFNSETLQFIVNQSRVLLGNNPDAFGDFYCYNVYAESNYIAATRVCNVSVSDCESFSSKAELYNTAFAEDFGDYWTTVIQPNLLPTCGGGVALKYSFSVLFLVIVIGFVL